MTDLRRWPQPVACAVVLLFCMLCATPSWANVIYEYREGTSSAVIGTLEIASPPASATSIWETIVPSDVIALSLDDIVFGLGTGNLLSVAFAVDPSVPFGVFSFDGSNLDIGEIHIIPTDPTIARFIALLFGVPAGEDVIGLAKDGVLTDHFGDWTDAAVPEPGTFALVAIGLAAAGRATKRRRR